MISSHQRDQQKSHSDYHFRMCTRSEVSAQSQSAESKLVSWNQACSLLLPHQMFPQKSNLLKCIMNNYKKLNQETMSDSTLRTSLLKKSEEEMSAVIPRMTHPRSAKTSEPRSLFLTTQDKSKPVIAQSWIATLLILLASSLKSTPRSTEEQAKN